MYEEEVQRLTEQEVEGSEDEKGTKNHDLKVWKSLLFAEIGKIASMLSRPHHTIPTEIKKSEGKKIASLVGWMNFGKLLNINSGMHEFFYEIFSFP